MKDRIAYLEEVVKKAKREDIGRMIACSGEAFLKQITKENDKELIKMLQREFSGQAEQLTELIQYHFGAGQMVRGIELGTLNGLTVASIIDACPNLEVISIDCNPEHPEWTKRMTGFEDRSMLIVARTDDAIKMWRKMHMGMVDFVWIDADHAYVQVKRDIENYAPLIKKGGFIGGHDYSAEGSNTVWRAVYEIYGKAIIVGADGTWWKYL